MSQSVGSLDAKAHPHKRTHSPSGSRAQTYVVVGHAHGQRLTGLQLFPLPSPSRPCCWCCCCCSSSSTIPPPRLRSVPMIVPIHACIKEFANSLFKYGPMTGRGKELFFKSLCGGLGAWVLAGIRAVVAKLRHRRRSNRLEIPKKNALAPMLIK